jgi:hypothetical protein
MLELGESGGEDVNHVVGHVQVLQGQQLPDELGQLLEAILVELKGGGGGAG